MPVGRAVEQRDLAHLLVEQRRDSLVEDRVVGDDFLGRIAAGFRRTGEGLVDVCAQRGELGIQGIDAAADGGAVFDCACQGRLDLVHLVASPIGVPAILVEFGDQLRIHGGRSEHDIGGKAAFGVHVARDLANRAHHLQPALRDRDLVHGLVLRSRHIDGEPAADGGKRDDGSGKKGTDFHGIWAICAGQGMRAVSISGAN